MVKGNLLCKPIGSILPKCYVNVKDLLMIMNGYKMLTIEAKDWNMCAMILIILFYDSMVI